jgi:hypothetical protein
VKDNGIRQIFNKIIAEEFSNQERGSYPDTEEFYDTKQTRSEKNLLLIML